jgi:hypothetical protein
MELIQLTLEEVVEGDGMLLGRLGDLVVAELELLVLLGQERQEVLILVVALEVLEVLLLVEQGQVILVVLELLSLLIKHKYSSISLI